MIKYVRIHTLQCRGPVEGAPDREVEGTLLSAEEPAHAYDSDHRETGHDRVELWPAFHNGQQCWILSRRWIPALGYTAWGSVSSIIPLEEGIRILVERGVFRLEPPSDPTEPTEAGCALVERALGGPSHDGG